MLIVAVNKLQILYIYKNINAILIHSLQLNVQILFRAMDCAHHCSPRA